MDYGDPEYLVPDSRKPKATDNIFALAGFVASLIAAFVPLPTFLTIVVWLCAAGLSFLGLGKQPRVFAIAGLVICGLSLLFWVFAVFFTAFLIGAGISFFAWIFGLL